MSESETKIGTKTEIETNLLFTDGLIKSLPTHPELRGRKIYDKKVSGLIARGAQNGRISFTLRIRINGKKETTKLGYFNAVTNNVDTVRKRAMAEIGNTDPDAPAPKVRMTLNEMIDHYKVRRLARDGLIMERVKKKDGMPTDWEDQVTKLRAILAPVLHVPINRLKRDKILECKDAYIVANAKRMGKVLDPDESTNDKPLRQAFAALSSIMFFALDLGWISHADKRGLTIDAYGDRERYLLPGEWQRVATVINKLPNDEGLLLRFLLATGVRLSNALEMRWVDLYDKEELVIDVAKDGTPITTTIRDWRLTGAEMKGKKSQRIALVGEAVSIVDHFAKQKEEAKDDRKTVFTPAIIGVWRDSSSFYQREIEGAAQTARFHRQDLRRTLATYLGYAGLSDGHVSLVLAHAIGKGVSSAPQAAAVTKVYKRNARQNFGPEMRAVIENDTDLVIARARLRAQALLRDIENSVLSPLVERTIYKIKKVDNTLDMFGKFKQVIDPIKLEAPDKFAAWVKSRKLDEWVAGLPQRVKAQKAAAKVEKALAKKQAKLDAAKAKAKVAATKKAKAQPEDTTATVQ